MIDNVTEALSIFLGVENVLIVFLGVLIGAVIGAIPGMTTPMGVALALPFTFTLHPVTGILLLLGIYKGGLYGGSISAILLKAPGTPAASCTVLDGFPMAQRGEARRALDIALYASCIADLISNLALILLTGFLATFALRFGPPEFFALILFSLTVIAGVSGDSLARGMISACCGLLLATVGLDTIYGTQRLVFGNYELMSGFNFIPVLIGLFALPEIIDHFSRKGGDRPGSGALDRMGASLADLKRCMKSIVRGSLIGVALGAIPGIGGAPAAFLSYSEARRTSKNPGNFGQGEIEGVAAAEAGNNGVAGATMIPLLALGVPGDVTTAVILGAFMIHGLQPGPVMFMNNLPTIYAIFIGILLSSVCLLAIGKLLIGSVSRIADIPNRVLYPVVLVLCLFGAYAVNTALVDILVMFAMGGLGYLMLKLSIPAAPFLIGFILGPLLEDSFRQSLRLSDGGYAIFFSSSTSLFFWGLTALSLVLLLRGRLTVSSRSAGTRNTLAEQQSGVIMTRELNPDTPLGAYRYAFGVISDTHVNEDEDRCNSPFDVNRRANRRMRHLVRSLNARDLAFVVHVGDLVHPVPAVGDRYVKAAHQFHDQISGLRHPVHLTPGNHDVGDKPNNWAPAAGICDDFLAMWDKHFGADFHAFDHQGDRFIVMNAQIVNSGLEREQRQREWLERELANADGRRIFLFCHYPPYFVRTDEVENYDNIGEPGRSWLLGLMEQYNIEALFTGHVHNFWWNLFAETDCYLLPSTSFVRQDYSEMYRTPPGDDDEAGRNDRPKLGYAVVHVYDHGHTVEFIRTFGEETPAGEASEIAPAFAPHRLHPRTNNRTPFGFDMRQNWMEIAEIPPTGGLDEFDRKEVRNDYPLMALWQMGVRNLRVPFRDLLVEANRNRMQKLLRHGHRFTLFSFGEPSPLERRLALENQHIFDAWEIGVNWSVFEAEAEGIGSFARTVDIPVYLSRLRSSDELSAEAAGRYFHVINQGFLAGDQEQMRGILEMPELRNSISGFVFRVTANRHPIEGVREADKIAKRLGVKASVHIRMCGSNPSEAQLDDAWVSRRLAEAVLAASAYPSVRVFADTFTDNDRGYFVRNGALDRLCNPRQAFHAVRNLTGLINGIDGDVTVLNIEEDGAVRSILFDCGETSCALYLDEGPAGGVTLQTSKHEKTMTIDLISGAVAGSCLLHQK